MLLILLNLCPNCSYANNVYEANIQEYTKDRSVEQVEDYSPLSLLALADAVAAYAVKTGSATAYVLGAEIYQSKEIKNLSSDTKLDKNENSFINQAVQATKSIDWAQSRLSYLQGLQIKGVGPASSSRYQFQTTRDPKNIEFEGGKKVAVYAKSKVSAQVRFSIFDQNGALVCKTDWGILNNICSWTPNWTGSFQILVESQAEDVPVKLIIQKF
ncbi:MAG: hypothetical protein ABJ051_19850 [Lentilitoribacter sp.]